ncbi:MAG: hypothetical protein IPI19_07070 [Ignavibacteriales bacterium]|nr:hypothetical protein [Ignavibacteriales bacterium]
MLILVGAFGLSFIVLWINIFIFVKISSTGNDEKKIKVGIIQPNLDPWNKWELGSLDQILENYFELSQKCVDGYGKMQLVSAW